MLSAICYYGWPVIEAVLLLLPIPEPNDMKRKAQEYGSQAVELVKGVPAMISGDGQAGRAPTPGYQNQLNSAGSLQEDSGEEDDEEDIGKDPNAQQRALDYDSDEQENNQADAAQQELISLDGSSSTTKRKNVPKLKKPGK